MHPHLQLFHTTRHCGPKFSAHRDLVEASVEQGLSLRPAWAERFDWVYHHELDWNLEYGARALGRLDELPLRLRKLRDPPRTVFLHHGEALRAFSERELPRIEGRVVVYLGGTSYLPITAMHRTEFLEAFIRHPMIERVFVENKSIDSDRLVAMPVGLSFPEVIRYGPRLREIQSAVEIEAKIPRVLAGPWQPLPQRRRATEFAATTPELCDHERDKLPPIDYWKLVSRYRFVLSPPGKGMDCYRTWEILALRSIPIVESCNRLYAEVFRDLPVVVIEDYGEITRDNLDRWWHDLSPMLGSAERLAQSDHWWSRIEAAARGG